MRQRARINRTTCEGWGSSISTIRGAWSSGSGSGGYGNRGVDVVLNSLTGEGYVEASLGALGRGGRFVEISKREIWSEREMARRRPDVRYEVLALDEEMEREPERIGAVVREVVARMGRGELHALPGEGYGMSEARAAFRRMQQARHVGKLVLMAPGYRGKLDGAAGYLITGGLGGLGLEVARWAVERGARYVALNGRRAPEGAAEAAIEQLRAQGAEVEIVWGDVSREADVEAMLGRVRGSGRRLAGVFHLAGVLRDGALVNQEWSRFEEVLGPKARGAWHLHRHTAGDDPELFGGFRARRRCWGIGDRRITRRRICFWTCWRSTGGRKGCPGSASTGGLGPRWAPPHASNTPWTPGWPARAWIGSLRARD